MNSVAIRFNDAQSTIDYLSCLVPSADYLASANISNFVFGTYASGVAMFTITEG